MDLGRFGVWTSYRRIGLENAGEAARLVEELGYGTFWLGSSPRLPDVRPLLQATERIVVATGIVNIWQYDPAELAREQAVLAQEFPGRLLLGIGIGHPEATSDYRRPLTAMRRFLDGLADVPADALCVAALGPKMVDLAGERTLGTHPYFTPVEHTAFARERLGPGKLVAPELACVVDAGVEPAREYAQLYLGLTNYTSNLRRFGFDDEDFADGGSQRLLDAVVPQGTADEVASAARAHLEAGADHVCLQPVGVSGIPRAEWTALAGALGLS
jgi:probable F420-dependent oxidoreductase